MVPNTSILRLFSPHVAIRRWTSTSAYRVAHTSSASQIGSFLSKKVYTPPPWASELSVIPSHNYTLGQVSFAISTWTDHYADLKYFKVTKECGMVKSNVFLFFVIKTVSNSNSQMEPPQFARRHRSMDQGETQEPLLCSISKI